MDKKINLDTIRIKLSPESQTLVKIKNDMDIFISLEEENENNINIILKLINENFVTNINESFFGSGADIKLTNIFEFFSFSQIFLEFVVSLTKSKIKDTFYLNFYVDVRDELIEEYNYINNLVSNN